MTGNMTVNMTTLENSVERRDLQHGHYCHLK